MARFRPLIRTHSMTGFHAMIHSGNIASQRSSWLTPPFRLGCVDRIALVFAHVLCADCFTYPDKPCPRHGVAGNIASVDFYFFDFHVFVLFVVSSART